jgi:localization factor PodJL
MYARGLGVPQDDVQAYMWLTLAGALEPYLRDIAAEAREPVAARLSPAQLTWAREMAHNWRADSQPAPQVASPPRALTDEESAALADVQAKLAALGYDPGPADGVMGARTRAAIRAFQADAGLPVTVRSRIH